MLSGYLHNLRIGFGGLYKGQKKATIVSPVIGIMPRLSREQCLRALGMVEAGLSYSDFAGHHPMPSPEHALMDRRLHPSKQRPYPVLTVVTLCLAGAIFFC